MRFNLLYVKYGHMVIEADDETAAYDLAGDILKYSQGDIVWGGTDVVSADAV